MSVFFAVIALKAHSIANFTNILRAAFIANFIMPKIHNPKISTQMLLYKNAARRVLVKLTPVVNYINIFTSSFCTDFPLPKVTKPNCKKRKAAKNTFVQKAVNSRILVKFDT
jgi:hypothetical protein